MARTADPAIRTALIEAAAERMATDGLDALSLRRIATDVGTTTRGRVHPLRVEGRAGPRAVVVEAFARLEAELDAPSPHRRSRGRPRPAPRRRTAATPWPTPTSTG